MQRLIEKEFMDWKSIDKGRMPMLIYGARQVGKTYSIKAFAEEYYESSVYVNFDRDMVIGAYFGEDISPEHIISVLEKYYQVKIDPDKTLIIFDEIQKSERALASLKYFAELAPEYHIIAAGSLLGVAVNREVYNFPVGKVMIKNMYPMNFEEYLLARNEDMMVELIRQGFETNKTLPEVIHNKALDYYKDYLVTGGMPAVVWNSINNYSGVEDEMLRNLIIQSYTSDMAKYASASENIKTRSAYESLPAQLAKENKKFQYKLIKKGARASVFGESIDWLIHSGVVLKCGRITEGFAPIKAYEDLSGFKLYSSDIGLLCQQSGLTRFSIDQPSTSQYLGGVIENYVACELVHSGYSLFYWESKGKAEVDFVISIQGMPIPIEVKSSTNNRSRSLNEFVKKYAPLYSIRISKKNFGFENSIKSVPLYAVFCMGV